LLRSKRSRVSAGSRVSADTSNGVLEDAQWRSQPDPALPVTKYHNFTLSIDTKAKIW